MDTPSLFPKTKEEILREKLQVFYLPERSYGFLWKLLEGQAREEALICCHSGCEVCNETILNCLEAVREEWKRVNSTVSP